MGGQIPVEHQLHILGTTPNARGDALVTFVEGPIV